MDASKKALFRSGDEFQSPAASVMRSRISSERRCGGRRLIQYLRTGGTETVALGRGGIEEVSAVEAERFPA
jgi:hypothetical protein